MTGISRSRHRLSSTGRCPEAVDTARALTAACYGIVTTVDEAGVVRDFVSSGFTEAEHRQFIEWTDGPKLFAHLRDLPGPVRLTDLPARVRSLGFSPDLMRPKTFQGTPIRHHGETVGHFFLAEKEGAPAFTDDDEEVLMLFASQAATAIANARAHTAEQRARCRSTARRGASSRACAPGSAPRRSCSTRHGRPQAESRPRTASRSAGH